MALADVLSVDGGYLDIDGLSNELRTWLGRGGVSARELEELAGNDRALRGRSDFVRLLERIEGAAIGGALLAHVAANRARAAGEGGLRFTGVPTLEATMMGVTMVRPGDSGAHVERIQGALADLGYPARPTGRYDVTTGQSVRRFQRDFGLRVDGEVGRDTLGALAAIAPPPGMKNDRAGAFERARVEVRAASGVRLTRLPLRLAAGAVAFTA